MRIALNRTIAAIALPLATVGATLVIGQGTANAAPWICTSGKASATQLASPMCTGASGSEGGESTGSEWVVGPESLAVYDPEHRLDGPHYGDHTYIDNPNVP